MWAEPTSDGCRAIDKVSNETNELHEVRGDQVIQKSSLHKETINSATKYLVGVSSHTHPCPDVDDLGAAEVDQVADCVENFLALADKLAAFTLAQVIALQPGQ